MRFQKTIVYPFEYPEVVRLPIATIDAYLFRLEFVPFVGSGLQFYRSAGSVICDEGLIR